MHNTGRFKDAYVEWGIKKGDPAKNKSLHRITDFGHPHYNCELGVGCGSGRPGAPKVSGLGLILYS